MPDTGARIGDWLVLYIQFPGRKLEPAGILLLDPETDDLFIKLGDLSHGDEEIEQIWELLPDDILQQSRELGGEQVLSSFERTWSNTFQIGNRQKISINNPQHTLANLFHEHIGPVVSIEKPAEMFFPKRITQGELLQARKRLPRSSQVVGQALQAIRSDKYSNGQIADIISEEPVLAAHLINLANSALYQYRGGEVRSVVEAINRLGTNLVQRQIVAGCLRPLFASAQLRDVWDHSVDVASVCAQLSFLSHHPKSEEAILVGLVHDIGKIVFASLEHSLPNRSSSHGGDEYLLYEAEQKRYGVHHSEVGADLLADWNFPEDMVAAVRSHHRPQDTKSVLCSMLYLAESWIENNEEGTWQISDHVYALNTTKLSPHYFLSLKIGTNSELEGGRSDLLLRAPARVLLRRQ